MFRWTAQVKQFIRSMTTLIVGLLLLHPVVGAESRIAILGDSITYDGRWATMVESALLNTPQFKDAEIVNFGLASETVSGLSEPGHAGGKFPRPNLHERLERILDAYKPTLVLACYGMNDGIYQPLEEARTKAFQDGISKLKKAVEDRGAKVVFITAPLHQADKAADDPNRYDAVLDAYAAWLVSKRANGWSVIDIRPDLKNAVKETKAANPAFVYAKDQVHPGTEGHEFIAQSICRHLWPILKLPGEPEFAKGDALATLSKRNGILKHAWLTKTRHIRPGVPAGMSLDAANAEAAKLMDVYRTAASVK